MQKLQILHISDLHIKKDKAFDMSVVLDPLLDRTRRDLYGEINSSHCRRIHA